MPAMKELQLCNCHPNVAGAARSYGVIVMAVARDVGARKSLHSRCLRINTRRVWKRPIVQLVRRKPAGGMSPIPSAAPSTGAFAGNSPQGCGREAARWRRGRSPFRQPPVKARNAGSKRQPGRLSFGYFSLAEQRKVSRLRGRDPDSINRRASDTLLKVLGYYSR